MSPRSDARNRDLRKSDPKSGDRTKGSAAAAPSWRREAAGRYRSSDGRFEIEGDQGRWYVRDSEERDELGLERTIGPFATLDGAKEDATARRERPPESSPLAARLAGAGGGADGKAWTSGPLNKEGRADRVGAARGGAMKRGGTSGAPTKGAPRRTSEHAAVRAEPEPPPPTWLDRLDADRPSAGRVARRRIAALERLGIDDAEAIVRRDIEADEPAVVQRLLARAIGRAVSAAVEEASGGKPDPARLADRVLEAALEQLSGRERDAAADPVLPGWRLIERDPDDPTRGRRIRLTAEDVRRGVPEG